MILGEHDIENSNESILGEKRFKVEKYIDHQHFDGETLQNDITLLRVYEDINLHVYTPACLPNSKNNFDGHYAWAYGKSYLFNVKNIPKLNFMLVSLKSFFTIFTMKHQKDDQSVTKYNYSKLVFPKVLIENIIFPPP